MASSGFLRASRYTKRILIIDDEPDVLDVLKTSLERQKEFQVAVARNGEEAQKIMEKETPDLVVFGLAMPALGAQETLKFIRKNFKDTKLPVIISTAIRETSLLLNFRDSGATDYVMKPYDIREVNKVISQYI